MLKTFPTYTWSITTNGDGKVVGVRTMDVCLKDIKEKVYAFKRTIGLQPTQDADVVLDNQVFYIIESSYMEASNRDNSIHNKVYNDLCGYNMKVESIGMHAYVNSNQTDRKKLPSLVSLTTNVSVEEQD